MELNTRPLTTAEVAALAKVDRRTIVNWVQSGLLTPLYRAGETVKAGYLFDPDVVAALLAEKASA